MGQTCFKAAPHDPGTNAVKATDVLKGRRWRKKRTSEVQADVEPVLKSEKAEAAAPAGPYETTDSASAPAPDAGEPEAVTNPDTSLILNMLDPENGPASGLPYQVHHLGPPRPPCEAERMETLCALGPMNNDRAPDPEISSILRLVASVFNAPAALCALFDEKRVFISEQAGDVVPAGDFPWRWTLCGWSMAFKNPQVLVIPDTFKDVRFTNNPKCTVSPGVRFYCGAPLIASNGHRLGTLCFADVKPRVFDAASCVMMNNMSELVVRQLEKDIALKLREKGNQQLARTYAHLQRTMDCFEQCVVLLDTSEEGWRVVYSNASWTRITGCTRDTLVGSLLSEVLEMTDGTALPSPALLQAAAKLKATKVKMARVRDPNVTKVFSLQFRPAGRQGLDDSTITLGVPSFLPVDGSEEKAQRFYFMTMNPVGSKQSSIISSSIAPSVSLAYSSTSSEGSVDGLELAHLLGRGSFGWVYYGTWYGSPVAIKVVDDDVKPVGAPGYAGPNMEALMTHELRHPNIVATLKYVTRSVPMGRAPTWDDYALGSQRPGMTSKSGLKSGVKASDSANSGHATHSGLLSAGSELTHSTRNPSVTGRDSTDVPSYASNAGGEYCSEKAGMEAVLANGWAVIDVGMECDGDQAMWGEEEDGNATASRSSMHKHDSCDSNACSTVVSSSNSMRQTWMIMEFCDKGCVQDAVDRGWLRTNPDCMKSEPHMPAVIATAMEIASAMRYLHSLDIVHGDLTGWNVMLSSSGPGTSVGNRGFVAKVADFGMARAMDVRDRIMTKTYGTLTHMPPETLVNGIVSKAMDVYSFGVLLWQMFTGSRPWSGLTHAQIVLKVAQQGLKLQWQTGTPTTYQQLASDCMSSNPDERPSFDEVVKRLENIRTWCGFLDQ
ncbi:mixed lineage protein kinase [Haematococcus lacustris]